MANIYFEFEIESARAALCYFATREIKLDRYMACKLLFLADKRHLVRYGRPITGDSYAAMPHGPVPSTILDMLENLENEKGQEELMLFLEVDKQYKYPRYRIKRPFNFEETLSKTDIEVLTQIADEFGKKTFPELRAITHEMPAYKKAWQNDSRKSFPMNFEDFFEEDEDAVNAALEEMKENFAIVEALKDVPF